MPDSHPEVREQSTIYGVANPERDRGWAPGPDQRIVKCLGYGGVKCFYGVPLSALEPWTPPGLAAGKYPDADRRRALCVGQLDSNAYLKNQRYKARLPNTSVS